ncbi:MAG: DUF695 domain-containing protein [Muribaculaceae bacterium]|nr:DUF695 domain-containing protein [Muribaculaceae bacterium]
MKERWWTAPTESESGATVLVTGRDCMDEVIAGGKYIYRVTVSWDYNRLPNGMPEDADARLMEKATDALQSAFKKDKVAYMTGIYTGDGRRDWIFYTKNLNIFNKVFNKALEELDTMPLAIEAEADPEWEEYKEMREISYIPEDESEKL